MSRDDRGPEPAAPGTGADGDLTRLDVAGLRRRRAESVDAETGVSYLRRLAQGALDIARGEQARRATGTGGDLAGLVHDLPAILGEAARPEGRGRISPQLEPTQVEPALQAELDELVGGIGAAAVTAVDDAELARLVDRLAVLERKISARRREMHVRIDALQAELVRRYRSGEATVESLLE